MPSQRTTSDVLHDHLRQSTHGTVEDDLARNYAHDVVLLCEKGVFDGHDGVRTLAETLRSELPQASFHYRTTLVARDVGFLQWSAESPAGRIDDGADSYVIRDGRIVAQTINYTIVRRGGRTGSLG